jgi:hypothetical protein
VLYRAHCELDTRSMTEGMRIEPYEGGAATPAVQTAPSRKAKDSTKYNDLIVESYNTPERFNILATASLWTLLAGFVVFPGTFTSLQNTSSLSSSVPGRVVQRTIQNVPLLAIAVFFFLLGMVGVGWLWQQRRRQYLWLADKVFLYVATASIYILLLARLR